MFILNILKMWRNETGAWWK